MNLRSIFYNIKLKEEHAIFIYLFTFPAIFCKTYESITQQCQLITSHIIKLNIIILRSFANLFKIIAETNVKHEQM